MANTTTQYAVPDLSQYINAVQLINPKKSAYAQTNAQFNPQISSLARAIAALRTNTKSNQADISNWYGHVANMYQQAASQDQSYSDAETGDLNHTLSGLAAHLGPAGEHVAPIAAVLAKEFAGENAASHSYLTAMRPIIGLQGAEQHVNEQKLGQQYGSLLQGKLADTRAAKGNSFVQALQDAIQTRDQEAVAKGNMAATNALLPAQIQQAGLDTDLKKQTLTTAQQLAPVQLAQAQAALKATKQKAGPQGFNLNDPAQLASIRKSLIHAAGLDGPKGVFQYDPTAAYQNELSALEGIGLGDSPQAEKLAQSIVAEGIRRSHAKKSWGQWYIAPDGSIKRDPHRARFVQPKK